MRGIGIEITDSLLRAAVVDLRGQNAAILGYYEQPVEVGEGPWAERAAAALKELQQQARLPRAEIVASLQAAEAHFRTLSMPVRDDEQIAKLVKFELEQHLHQFAAEDIIVDFHKVSETEKGATVLCAAVPKALIAERLAALQGAGLDPMSLDLDLYGACRAMMVAGGLPDTGMSLLVHGTERFAKLMLLEEGAVRLVRSIRFSIPEMTEAQKEEVVKKKAWDTKDVSGPVPLIILAAPQAAAIEDLAAPTQTSVMNHLAKEIQRFLMAAGSEAPDQVLLSGEFSSAKIVNLLSRRIKVPVRTTDVLEAFDHPFDRPEIAREVRRKIAPALGLALRAAKPDADLGPALELRQEEHAYARGLSPYAGTFLVMLQLLVVLVASFGLKLYLNGRHYESLTRQVRQAQVEQARAFLTTRYREDAPPVDQIREEYNSRGGRGEPDHPVRRTAYEVLGEFYVVLAPFAQRTSNLIMDLESVRADIDNGRVEVRGTINSQDHFNALTRDLGARPAFAGEAPTSNIQWDERLGSFRFTLSLPMADRMAD